MSKKLPIYLDYMATTPVDPRVVDEMVKYLTMTGVFGNPASKTHTYGIDAMAAVEKSRATIAHCVGASEEEIIFTSGATESNNLAIMGAARFHARKGRHLITQETEHKAVLDCFKQLESEGFEVTYLKPCSDGLLDFECLRAAIKPTTTLVSIMHVNNEIGVIQDIKAIGEYLRSQGILFHVDAAQSIGKTTLNLTALPVDLMSFSSHKVYGPKGIGALYLRHRPRVRILPISYGGGQERGLRPGTLATHQIIGMAKAFEIAHECFDKEYAQIKTLSTYLWNELCQIPGVTLNGDLNQRVPHNLNVTFKGIEGSTLLYALKDLALSSTSACASASGQPSYVLTAIGLSQDEAYSTIRISIGRYTTLSEVKEASKVIRHQIERLRFISSRI